MNTPSALLTDLYQLTMAYGYWKSNRHEHEAVFHLFFRKAPFGGEYAIACGLQQVIRFIQDFTFTEEDIAYLTTLESNGQPLFSQEFLTYLANFSFTGNLYAIPEGTAVLAKEPLLRVHGTMLECQILESALLNLINFPTLIATKAARICEAAQGDPVLEFGLRRAQGPDGALTASRAAYIGGCAATSNVESGRVWGIPVRGTHGHSWVMSFDSEEEAFDRYAEAMPDNCILLADTYDTIRGIERAIEVGKGLKKKGKKLNGIRLDSGDLCELSIIARKMLDEAGFEDALVVASDDLEEDKIEKLKAGGARIGLWGVGTNLVTARSQPSLGGVYKLAAIRKPGEAWKPKIKLSDTPAKNSLPGYLQVIRTIEEDGTLRDEIFDEWEENRELKENQQVLLQEIFRDGHLVYLQRDLPHIREFAQEELTQMRESGTKGHLIVAVSDFIARRADKLAVLKKEN